MRILFVILLLLFVLLAAYVGMIAFVRPIVHFLLEQQGCYPTTELSPLP
jgi:hypothetical protein